MCLVSLANTRKLQIREEMEYGAVRVFSPSPFPRKKINPFIYLFILQRHQEDTPPPKKN